MKDTYSQICPLSFVLDYYTNTKQEINHVAIFTRFLEHPLPHEFKLQSTFKIYLMKELILEIKIDQIQIKDILNNEVIKRDGIEGEKVKDAMKMIKKISTKIAKNSDSITAKSEKNGSNPKKY